MMVRWTGSGRVLLLNAVAFLAQTQRVLATQFLYPGHGRSQAVRDDAVGAHGALLQEAQFEDFITEWLERAMPEGSERQTTASDSRRPIGIELGDLVAHGAARMTLSEAISTAALPSTVMTVLRASGLANATRALPNGLTPASGIEDANSAKQAVGQLNDMYRHTEDRIDTKTLECVTISQRNRADYAQVQSQLAQLDGEIGSLTRTKGKAMAKISASQHTLDELLEEQERKKREFALQQSMDEAVLKERKADVEVSEYMLGLTACEPYQTLLQQRQGQSSLVSRKFEFCNSSHGNVSISFQDDRLRNFTSRLSPEAQGLLDKDLIRMHLQFGADMGPGSGSQKMSFRCRMQEPQCSVLHDTFVGLWGSVKDQADALQDKIVKTNALHAKSRIEFNLEMQSLTASIASEQAALAEASSGISAEAERQTQKQQQLKELQRQYLAHTAECKETLRLLMYSTLCAIRKVRYQLIKAQLPQIAESGGPIDCVVGDWRASPCSVPCADNGTAAGVQNYTRDVIRTNSELGVECPTLGFVRPCNDFPCPVDCELTEWTSWSKCTKDCGGGVQSRIRAVMTQPANGGMACNVGQETQPCNTGSCDVDCELSEWSEWTPCSKACDGGYFERSKDVQTEAEGSGICFDEDDSRRYEKDACNEQACIGDEVCRSEMELVVALDSSGSMSEKGFEALRTFTVELIKRFRATAYGQEAVKVSVILFGNGHLLPGRVVSDAMLVSPLATPATVAPKVEALTWSGGFTNLAQALLKANDVLQSGARNVKSTVLVVTDGPPSFVRQTTPVVEQLRKVARLAFVHVQQTPEFSEVELFKRYASRPWQTNYVNIPGQSELTSRLQEMVTQVVAEICPRAESPSKQAALDTQAGFKLVLENKNCISAVGKATFTNRVASAQDCYNYAVQQAVDDFDMFALENSDGSDLKECSVYKSCKNTTVNGTFSLYEPIRAT